MIRYSIIIVTRNRAGILKETLPPFLELDGFDAPDFEIIVVDNNSTDQTGQVIAECLPLFGGRLRSYREEREGIPQARNRGIAEAHGEVIAFVDDDCRPAKDYLVSLRKIFDGLDPAVGFVGGKIELLLVNGARLPEWHTYPFFRGPLAVLDCGPKPWVLRKETLKEGILTFYTANMAARKELFDRWGYFDEFQRYAGDTEICLRWLNNGVHGEYRPDLLVHHKIGPARLTPAAFRRWYYIRGKFREATFPYTRKFHYPFGVPFWLLRRILYFTLLSLVSRPYGRRLELQCNALFLWGQAVKIATRFGM